jgi:tetratricopeptide (TPR) repeat protein
VRGLALCFLLAFTALAPLPASAQASDDTLAKAEAAYRKGDYETARAAYEAWLAAHPGDGRAEYNLGNCEYRLERPAHALWRYERARRRLGDREDLLFNRQLAMRRLGQAEGEGKGLLAGARERLAAFESGDWLALGLGLELFGLLGLVVALRRRTPVTAGVFAMLVAGGLACGVQSLQVRADRLLGVIVLEDRTPLRAEPRAELPAVVALAAGVRARFVEKSPDWVRVRLESREGWLPARAAGMY